MTTRTHSNVPLRPEFSVNGSDCAVRNKTFLGIKATRKFTTEVLQ